MRPKHQTEEFVCIILVYMSIIIRCPSISVNKGKKSLCCDTDNVRNFLHQPFANNKKKGRCIQ